MKSTKSILEAKDERFEAFVVAVVHRNPVVGSTLAICELKRLDGGNLWIGVNTIGFDILMKHRGILSEEAAKLFDLQEITVEIVTGSQ